MSFLPQRDVRGSRRFEQESPGGEIKRTAYVLAHTGLVGFAIRLLRSEFTALLARYFTSMVAGACFAAALVMLAIGNNMHIGILSFFAGWSLLIVPLLWMAGWIRREKEEAWAADHGRGTTEFQAALEADERRVTEETGKDDWLVHPPWKERAERRRDEGNRPRFGRG